MTSSVVILLLGFVLADAIRLRTGHDSESGVGSSLLSLSSATMRSGGGNVDWWLWIVVGGLILIAGIVTYMFRKPSTEGIQQNPKLILTTSIISCQQIVTRSSPQIDPVQLGVTVKGKSSSGEFIELYHDRTAHETDTISTKFAWDDSEFNWILNQPLTTAGPFNELVVQLEHYSSSGGLIAAIATGIVSLKPPVVGSMITPRPAVQLVELVSTASSGGSVWGNMELSLKYDPVVDETFDQLEIARKQIYRKLRITKPLFVASHSLAFVLIILDSFFGIRYLFSGCFASSVQALVSAGLISLLSVPMAAEWGQMHYNLPSWAVKVGKLNCQFKATVLLACAIPQTVIAFASGAGSCSKFFQVLGGLTYIDFVLFSALFVQAEANGHVAALFHFNCFKRPLPPALPSTKEETVPSVTVSPNSYSARRPLRQNSNLG
jgi:hypothetical protein